MCGRNAAANTPSSLATGPAIPHARRNRRLGVAAGAIGGLGQAFVHPELIIAGLIYALTGSPALVALVTIISKAGALAPQLWASSHLEHRPRKMPSFVLVTVVRSVGFAGLLAAMWLLTRQVAAVPLALFFAAYLLTCVCGGTGHVIFMDMVGRMIPTQRLGSFFGARYLLGSMLAILAGVAIIQPVLGRVELPVNYLLLAAVGGLLAIADMTVFARCREEDGPRAEQRTTLRESLQRGMRWLRTDHNYRMYFWGRIAFRINYLGLAFFIPYGTERLRYEGRGGLAVLGGVMVATMQLSRLAASVIWGRAADRRGFRACLIGGGVCFFLAPSLALLAPILPPAFQVPIPGAAGTLDLPLTVYLLALVVLGLGFQGNMLGGNHFIVSSAPPHRRASYLGFLNTVTSPLTLLPLAGAALAAKAGMSAVFGLAVIGGLVSLLSALRMRPVALEPTGTEAEP